MIGIPLLCLHSPGNYVVTDSELEVGVNMGLNLKRLLHSGDIADEIVEKANSAFHESTLLSTKAGNSFRVNSTSLRSCICSSFSYCGIKPGAAAFRISS